MTLHRLALALGRTVSEIESTMPAAEFGDWVVFCHDHPLPFELVDIHAGQILAMLFNAHKTSTTPAAQPIDFMVLARKAQAKPVGSIAQRMKAVAQGS